MVVGLPVGIPSDTGALQTRQGAKKQTKKAAAAGGGGADEGSARGRSAEPAVVTRGKSAAAEVAEVTNLTPRGRSIDSARGEKKEGDTSSARGEKKKLTKVSSGKVTKAVKAGAGKVGAAPVVDKENAAPQFDMRTLANAKKAPLGDRANSPRGRAGGGTSPRGQPGGISPRGVSPRGLSPRNSGAVNLPVKKGGLAVRAI